MCTVSMIGDEFGKTIPTTHPWTQPYIAPSFPQPHITFPTPDVSREEFDALKKEMEELKKLLLAAKEFDTNTGQPDCEVDEKVALLRKLAGLVGVDLEEVFGAVPD